MTVGELNRALEPFFKVADQALKMRDLLKVAQETEEAVATLRQARDRAVLEADKAKAEAEAQQGHLADAKRAADQEAERYRKQQLDGVLKHREDVRRDIMRLNDDAQAQRIRLEAVTREAGLAERESSERRQAMRNAEATIQAEHDEATAARRVEIAALDRETQSRREALREVNEHIAALTRR